MTDATGKAKDQYEPPRLAVLGSFGKLTQGGTLPDLDGQGGAGVSEGI